VEVNGECHLREKSAITAYHDHIIIRRFIQSKQFDLQRREKSSEMMGKNIEETGGKQWWHIMVGCNGFWGREANKQCVETTDVGKGRLAFWPFQFPQMEVILLEQPNIFCLGQRVSNSSKRFF
jgi:hypothetical protein